MPRKKSAALAAKPANDLLAKKNKTLRRIPAAPNGIICLYLASRGKRDGAHGLPWQDGNGRWASPYIASEQHKAETFKAQMWAELEIETSPLQERAQELALKIKGKESALTMLRNEAPEKLTLDEQNAVNEFEQGKDAAIIRKRRQAQWNRQHAGYFAKVKAMRKELEDLREERAECLATIEEAVCITRLICEKKREHHRQRMDAYYHGALQTNPARDTMPPTLEVHWENFAEALYAHQHGNRSELDDGGDEDAVLQAQEA